MTDCIEFKEKFIFSNIKSQQDSNNILIVKDVGIGYFGIYGENYILIQNSNHDIIAVLDKIYKTNLKDNFFQNLGYITSQNELFVFFKYEYVPLQSYINPENITRVYIEICKAILSLNKMGISYNFVDLNDFSYSNCFKFVDTLKLTTLEDYREYRDLIKLTNLFMSLNDDSLNRKLKELGLDSVRGWVNENSLQMLENSAENMTEEELLLRIENRFKELYSIHGEVPERNLEEIDQNLIREDFNKYGFVVVKNIPREIFIENELNLIEELSLFIFGTKDIFNNSSFLSEYNRIIKKYPDFSDNEKILATLSMWWNSETGFGNPSFRFIFFQYLQENPKFKIGDELVEFSRNPIHRHSIRMLSKVPQLWNLLKSFHSSGSRPMISWDSQKVRFQDTGKPLSKDRKSTKPQLTIPHRDVYKNEGITIDRIQAMLISQNPGAISLGYVLFSHDPEIQRLGALLMKKEEIYFSSINNDKFIDILNKYWRAPEGFIIWKQETVHYEAEPTPNGKFSKFEQSPKNLRLFSFRIVIGTQIPINLDEISLYELAYLAETGWCPEIYNNKTFNRKTKVHVNVVDRKSTRYLHPRNLTEYENISLEYIRQHYTQEEIIGYIRGLPKIIQEMYGIYN